jgi:hypothetical protein
VTKAHPKRARFTGVTRRNILALDAVTVSLTTSSDPSQSAPRFDGTFLVLVRASRGEEPDVLVHLRTGEQVQALL